MIKEVQVHEEMSLIFTDAEMEELKLKRGDKFTITAFEDGSFSLTPFKTIPIELDQFTKDQLIGLIIGSVKLNMNVEEFIEHVLHKFVEDNELGF